MNARNCVWIGVDVGSISCKVAVLDASGRCLASVYRRTRGRVIESVKESVDAVADVIRSHTVAGCGTTGSARQLVGALVGADVVKNEITAHACGARHLRPDAQTLLEIGGEDSKIILLRDGLPVDFAMNTVCAAGTGAFLDQLAHRLGIAIEDLGDLALQSTQDVAIAGRCTVFAESDIIFKQQAGHRIEDIVAGACRSLARNYLNDVGKGKEIKPPVLLLGGVAANTGIERAFSDALGLPIEVPREHNIVGAMGAALLAKSAQPVVSRMRSVGTILASDFKTQAFVCEHCDNHCEVVRFVEDGVTVGTVGGRCERWAMAGTVPVQ